MAHYESYFDMQTGGARSGYGGISQVYIGSPHQRGHGIGSFLGGLFHRIIPLLKQGARAVGKEALRAGVNVASDIMDNGVQPREAFKTRLRESGTNLQRKAEEKINSLMSGSGYKAAKIKSLLHYTRDRTSNSIGGRKRKKPATSRKRFVSITKKKKRRRSTGGRRGKTASGKVRKTSVLKKKRSGKKRKSPRSVSDIFA